MFQCLSQRIPHLRGTDTPPLGSFRLRLFALNTRFYPRRDVDIDNMQMGIPPRLKDFSFLSLMGVLVAGILADFILSPGPILTDIPEAGFPLGILIGFLVFAYITRFQRKRERLEKRAGQFGWFGALLGGTIGAWLIIQQLFLGVPIPQVHDVALTALDIGILAGALVGITTATTQRGAPELTSERERILAESTWTNRPEPNPILVEIVTQIAELKRADPLEMEPLTSHINPDVFSAIRDGSHRSWQVLFYTDEYEIRVNSQGTVTVYDIHKYHEDATTALSVQAI